MRAVLFVALAAAVALTGCAEREVLLTGEREPVRASSGPVTIAAASRGAVAAPLSLPAPRRVGDWPLRVGTPTNDPAHATLSAAPTRAWSADIGRGDTRRQRVTADPVSDGARIYTLDARARITATTLAGGTAWSRSLVPALERETDAAGGGIAVAGGIVFVATGFGDLHALDAATGAERWVQRLDAPLTSPKPVGDLVYLVSRDARAWAIDRANGRIRWELPAAPAAAVTTAAPSPAVTDRLAIFPYGSGEIVAALRGSGVRVWGSGVSGRRRGVAYNAIGDVTGDPVVAGDVVYAGTTGGRIVALNLGDGTRRWTATEGAVSPLVVAGGSVFAVTDRAQLVRLDAATGGLVWRADLPFYRTRRIARREGAFAHFGPVLAGGRLWVASSDGALRGFDPASGALAVTADIPGGAASRPIAMQDALFVVGRRGTLHAFR